MATETIERARRICRERGVMALAGRALKRAMSPVVRFGSFYVFECDLNNGLPQVRMVPGVTVREASLSDLSLLGECEETAHTRKEAAERLQSGHRWFVGIEEQSGKLANYRWVAATTAYIPETGRDLILGPGEIYIYDLVTLPEFRRRGIDSYVRHWIYSHLQRSLGIKRILMYIHPDNSANLAASRRFMTRVGRVWYVRIAGRGVQLLARGDRMPEFRPAAGRRDQDAVAARTLNPRRDANS